MKRKVPGGKGAIARLQVASGGTWNAMKTAPGVRTSIDGTGMRLSQKLPGKFEISLEAVRVSPTAETMWWWIVTHPTFEIRFMRGEHAGHLFPVPGTEIDREALDEAKKMFGGDIAFENSNNIDVLQSSNAPRIPEDAREIWLRYHGTLVAITTGRYSRFRVPRGVVVMTYAMPGCPSTEFQSEANNGLPNAYFRWYGSSISKAGSSSTATYVEGDTMPDLELRADDPVRKMGVWIRRSAEHGGGWSPGNVSPGVARLSRLIRVYGPGVYHVTACMNANEPKIEKNLARLATHSKRARARKDSSVDALYDEYLRLLETKPTKEALEKFSRKMSGFNDPK